MLLFTDSVRGFGFLSFRAFVKVLFRILRFWVEGLSLGF